MREKSLQLGHTDKEVAKEFEDWFSEHNLRQDCDPATRMLAETMTMQAMPQAAATALELKLREMLHS